MNQKWINSIVLVTGMILGPFVFLSLRENGFAFGWWEISVIFLASLFGAVFVVGIPILWNNAKFEVFILDLLSLVSSSLVGIGITSMATAVLVNEFGSLSLLFLAVGVGLMIGVVFSKLFSKSKYDEAL